MTTVVYDTPFAPRVTLTKSAAALLAVIEVDGLDPQRSTTPEERFVGIESLNPPTVRVPILRDPRASHRRLIDAAVRATQCSATSTLGSNGGPVALFYTYMRVSIAVRSALRLIGEEI